MECKYEVKVKNEFHSIADIVLLIETNLLEIKKELEAEYEYIRFEKYMFEKYVPRDSYSGVYLVDEEKYYIVFYFEVDKSNDRGIK